jgi:hypothetical protein
VASVLAKRISLLYLNSVGVFFLAVFSLNTVAKKLYLPVEAHMMARSPFIALARLAWADGAVDSMGPCARPIVALWNGAKGPAVNACQWRQKKHLVAFFDLTKAIWKTTPASRNPEILSRFCTGNLLGWLKNRSFAV